MASPQAKFPSPEFSRRLTQTVASEYWSASRPPGPEWAAGPDFPVGTCPMEQATDYGLDMLQERDDLIDACIAYSEYDELPKELKDKIDLIERFNEWYFDMEDRAIHLAEEQLGFVPVGIIPLTSDEKKAAKDAAKLANDEGYGDVGKWLEDNIESNPNAVRQVLAQMGLEDEE